MVIENGITFGNYVYVYTIKDNLITPIDYHRGRSSYKDILDRKIVINEDSSIFMHFISILDNDMKITNDNIISFCNKYGLLGLNRPIDFSEDFDDDSFFNYSENVNDFIKEIICMKAIIDLNEAIETYDFNSIVANYYDLYNFLDMNELGNNCFYHIEEINTFFRSNTMSFEDLELLINNEYGKEYIIPNCCKLITIIINHYLFKITPQLLNNDYNNNYHGNWRVNTLLSAMYMEIFLKFSKNKKIRKCQCTTCSSYFEIYGNDLRKKFCSTKCAQLEAQRNKRKRDSISND